MWSSFPHPELGWGKSESQFETPPNTQLLGPTSGGPLRPPPHPARGAARQTFELQDRAPAPPAVSKPRPFHPEPSSLSSPLPLCPSHQSRVAAQAILPNINKSLPCLHPPTASIQTWNEALAPRNPQTWGPHSALTAHQATQECFLTLERGPAFLFFTSALFSPFGMHPSTMHLYSCG